MPTQFEVQVGINSKAIQKILDDGKTIVQLPVLTGQLQSTDMVALYNVETGNTLKVTVAELIGALSASELGNDSSVPGATVADALDELNKKTRWRGQWVEGTYYSTDQVYDKGYLAIVKLGLNGTQQRPSPQPITSESWTLPDSPSWTSNLVDDTVTQMLRISNITGLASIDSFRIYIPDLSADANYITFGIDNNTGVITDGKSYKGTDFDQIGWHEIAIPVTWFNIGDDYSYYLRSNNYNQVTNESYQYFFNKPKNSEIPTTGQTTRRGDNTELLVNYTDDLNIDRSVTIKTLSHGDTVKLIQNSDTSKWIEYTIAENEDIGSYAKITVIISGFGPGGPINDDVTGTLDLTFAVQEATEYLTLNDYYSDYDSISGGIAIGDAAMAPNQNACGLDFRYILYSISTDWDIQAYPGATGSSGGDLSNYVDLDSAQTISGLKTFAKQIVASAFRGTRVDLGAGIDLSWGAGDTFLSDPLTAPTTFTFSDMPEGAETQQITHYVTGEETFSYPIYCIKLAGEYDGTVVNQIVFECVNGNSGSELVYYTINPLTI